MEDCHGTRLSILCQKECVSSFTAVDEASMIGLFILARLTAPSHSLIVATLQGCHPQRRAMCAPQSGHHDTLLLAC